MVVSASHSEALRDNNARNLSVQIPVSESTVWPNTTSAGWTQALAARLPLISLLTTQGQSRFC